MHLSSVWLVAYREYLENIRTKAFWLGAILMPIIFLVMLIVPSLFARDSDAIYGVIDQSGWVHDAVRKTIVERDIEQFLTVFANESPAVYDKIKDSEVREDLRTAVNNGLGEDDFRRELRDMILYLSLIHI